MKVLLDEHLSRRIAYELRQLAHDAAAVGERPGLRALDDRDLIGMATAEGRAIVTADVPDFARLARDMALAGEHHAGMILAAPRTFPRTTAAIGLLVSALDRLLRDRPTDDALLDQAIWLERA